VNIVCSHSILFVDKNSHSLQLLVEFNENE
jgi:hypothetical protein